MSETAKVRVQRNDDGYRIVGADRLAGFFQHVYVKGGSAFVADEILRRIGGCASVFGRTSDPKFYGRRYVRLSENVILGIAAEGQHTKRDPARAALVRAIAVALIDIPEAV